MSDVWIKLLARASNRHERKIGGDYERCDCRCYGCRFHCGAHWSWLLRTGRFWQHPIENYRWNRQRKPR